jgi:hypothetical protein
MSFKKTDATRQIEFIESDEDCLKKEAEWASNYSMNELFVKYCHHIATVFALSGIDVRTHPVERTIYYLDDGGKY